ncbi:MAG: hypothetical protein ABR961_08475 [Thermoanaerobaculaceae bacterium]|jgi:hypothetical protein
MKLRSNTVVACAIAAAAVAGPLVAQTPGHSKPTPGPATTPSVAGVRLEFGGSLLEITKETLDRFAKGLADEEEARKVVATATPKPAPRMTKTEYDACQQSLMTTPEYMQLAQEYAGSVSAHPKDATAARDAAQELMSKLGAMIEKTCGPDPSRSNEKLDTANRLREAETKAAESNGFTLRQYAVLKERVTPLCLSDPVPPDPAGLKLKGQGNALLVYTAAEVAALRPRCEAFVKLLYPDDN